MRAARPVGVAVTEVGLLARRILRNGRRGEIVAVFDRSLYVNFDGDLVCIGLNEIGSGPLHVLCDGPMPDALSRGQQVLVAERTLSIGDVALVGFDVARVWSPEPSPAWTHKTLSAGLLAVDALWHVAPAEEGLAAAGSARTVAPQSRVFAAAVPALAALQRLIDADLRGVAPHDTAPVAGLIGLGPGLTPSGDDLLGGAMVALASLGLFETRDLLWNALRAHLTCTNDISSAHLRSAAQGHAASALHDAINATMGGQTDRIAPALAAVSAIGHSSGRDAVAGALIVLRAVARQARQVGASRSAVAAA